jgi:hypothetical protein
VRSLPAAAVALLSLAALLAGCSSDDGGDTVFAPGCQWTQSRSQDLVNGGFFAADSDTERRDDLARGYAEEDGRPLAAVILDFRNGSFGGQSRVHGLQVVDGRVTVRFERFDDQQELLSYRDGRSGDRRASWTFEPGYTGNTTITVPLEKEGDWEPTSVVANWTFQRNLDRDTDTPSGAIIAYAGTRWYQDCF